MMEAAKRELQTKLTQLQMTRDKTETVLSSKNSNRIKRHVQSLQAIGNSTDEARRKLEGMKIEDGEDASAITSWSEEIENKISMVDEDVDKLAAVLTEAEQTKGDRKGETRPTRIRGRADRAKIQIPQRARRERSSGFRFHREPRRQANTRY